MIYIIQTLINLLDKFRKNFDSAIRLKAEELVSRIFIGFPITVFLRPKLLIASLYLTHVHPLRSNRCTYGYTYLTRSSLKGSFRFWEGRQSLRRVGRFVSRGGYKTRDYY